MNIYRTDFFATCPNNSIRIHYVLTIKTTIVIAVERIIAAVEAIETGFHEEIADALLARFGGSQTLSAMHHGVHIETERGMSTHEVQQEREVQKGAFSQTNDDRWSPGEWAALISHYATRQIVGDLHTVNLAKFRADMVKVGALAQAAIEAIDRKEQ